MRHPSYIVFACLTLASPAAAQVAVGYSSVTSATAGRVVDTKLDERSRSSFGVGGSNVEPIDGSSIYDAQTIWRIRDPSQTSSLILRQEDSVFDAEERETNTRLLQAQRQETVSTTLLPPLSNDILIRTSVSPFAATIPIIPSDFSTSVFP